MKGLFKLDFIGIGATKSGTTWLANCLKAHPNICLSEPKEVRYFNLYQPHFDGINKNHAKPFTWYEKHFRHCRGNSIKGEFSPIYMYDEKAPFLIKEYFPEIKLLACLRNPMDRTYSDYWMRRSVLKVENRTFESAIENDDVYIEKGLYCKLLKRYFELFDKSQILILFFDDIASDPMQTLRKTFEFLKVDPEIEIPPSSLAKKENAAKEIRFKPLMESVTFVQAMAKKLGFGFLSSFFKKAGVSRQVTNFLIRPIQYPDMDPRTRASLFNRFKDDIRELEKLLDRDLSHWN